MLKFLLRRELRESINETLASCVERTTAVQEAGHRGEATQAMLARSHGGRQMQTTTHSTTQWAKDNFRSCQLGDKRRNDRLIQVAGQVANHPAASLPGQTETWSDLKGTYTLSLLARPGQAAREAMVGLMSVVAVRLLRLKSLARTDPDVPAKRVVPNIWLQMLKVARQGLDRVHDLTVGQFYREVAKGGGFIGRKSDGQPGWITIWRGWEKLNTYVQAASLASKLKIPI